MKQPQRVASYQLWRRLGVCLLSSTKRMRAARASRGSNERSMYNTIWMDYLCRSTEDSFLNIPTPFSTDADRSAKSALAMSSAMNFDIATSASLNLKTEILNLLHTFCPKLTNPAEPGSIVQPPRFSYSHPDNPKYSDEMIQQMEKGTHQRKHREASESIRPVMDAIGKLSRSAAADPFLAVESLDFGTAEDSGLIRELFPSTEDQRLIISRCRSGFREYDIVLIGVQIGAIFIEVKGSDFRGGSKKRGQLPERYAKAFEQLEHTDSLLYFFDRATKLEIPSKSVRKIVFAPKLSKSRYDQWLNGRENKSAVRAIVGSTRQWFEEDCESGSLLDKLRNLLEEPGYSIDPENFYRGIRILAFLKAWPILKDPGGPHRTARLQSLFSERHARMDDFMALQLQKPEIVSENRKVEINNNEDIEFTQEQIDVLRGPDHQLIVGTGGTGKTIVLFEHAKECLMRGRSILVLATESFMESYRDRLEPVFHLNKAAGAKFEIRSWPKLLWSILDKIPNCRRIIWDIYRHNADVVDLASKLVTSQSEQQLFRFVDKFDDVILDDALEYTNARWITDERTNMNTNMKTLFVALAMMIYAKEYSQRPTTVWIGLDPKAIEWRHDRHPRIYLDTMERLCANNSIFSTSILKRVMRNAEEIFNLAYKDKFADQSDPCEPTCGHKISGRVHRVTICPEHSSQLDDLWRAVNTHLDKYLLDQKYKYSDIAIIVGGTASFEQTNNNIKFLFQKCVESEIPSKRLNLRKLHHAAFLGDLRGSENDVAPAKNAIDDDEKVSIDLWQHVSSKEWPIVLHVELIDFGRLTRLFDAVRIHRQYRVRTRAVSELVEICVIPKTSKRELLKCGIKHCCTREIFLDVDKDSLNTSGSMRYFPSNIHDFHGKRKCPKFVNGTYRSEKRTERLDDLAKIALELRDDLYREDTDQENRCVRRLARPAYETRLFSKTRKRCHSVGDLRNDTGHLALVLDCDLFQIVSRGLKFPLHHQEECRFRELVETEVSLKNRAVKRDIIELMDKVLWWKHQMSRPEKEQRLKEVDEDQNILAKALDSLNNGKIFRECMVKVERSVSSVALELVEYLRVNILNIIENGSRNFVRNER